MASQLQKDSTSSINGGVNLDSDNSTSVNGDVVGRDKIVSLSAIHGSELNEYFRSIEALYNKKRTTKNSKIATALTSAICGKLNSDEKAQLMRLIYELGLIDTRDPFINLANVDLSKARLAKAQLIDADLSSVDLSGADLSGANLVRANLSGADLTDAELPRAVLWNASLVSTDLTRAILRGTDLSGADLTNAKLTEADIASAIMVETTLDENCIEVAGQVWAGDGDVVEYIAELHLGRFYRFNVIGGSMIEEDILPGDSVIVRPNLDYQPSPEELIVTKYWPQPTTTQTLDETDFRVTLKYYLGEVTGEGYKLGWRKGNEPTSNHPGNPHLKIAAKIEPIGKVLAVRKRNRIRVWTGDV